MKALSRHSPVPCKHCICLSWAPLTQEIGNRNLIFKISLELRMADVSCLWASLRFSCNVVYHLWKLVLCLGLITRYFIFNNSYKWGLLIENIRLYSWLYKMKTDMNTRAWDPPPPISRFRSMLWAQWCVQRQSQHWGAGSRNVRNSQSFLSEQVWGNLGYRKPYLKQKKINRISNRFSSYKYLNPE